MYINFNFLSEKNISPQEALILICCNQMRFEDISDHLIVLCRENEENLLSLEDKGYLEFIKGKAKDTIFQRARLSSEGKKIVDNIDIASLTEDDIKVWDWLSNYYKSEGKSVGNAKKGKFWLSQFRLQSGLRENRLVKVCKDFLSSESFNYSQQLEYLFYKPANAFDTRFSLDGSKLWQFYQYNEKRYLEIFKSNPTKYGEY